EFIVATPIHYNYVLVSRGQVECHWGKAILYDVSIKPYIDVHPCDRFSIQSGALYSHRIGGSARGWWWGWWCLCCINCRQRDCATGSNRNSMFSSCSSIAPLAKEVSSIVSYGYSIAPCCQFK